MLADDSKDIFLAAFLHFASQYQLIEYEVCFLKVEDDIEFADVTVVFVHLLNVSMHNFEGYQLIVRRSATGDEEQGGISTIDNFCVCVMIRVLAYKDMMDGQIAGKNHLCIQENCTFEFVVKERVGRHL